MSSFKFLKMAMAASAFFLPSPSLIVAFSGSSSSVLTPWKQSKHEPTLFNKRGASSSRIAQLSTWSCHSSFPTHALVIPQCYRPATKVFLGKTSVDTSVACTPTSSSKPPANIRLNSNNLSGKEICEAEEVPSTWSEALNRFFFGEDVGPFLAVLSILGFAYTRVQLPSACTLADVGVLLSVIFFWWVQEYVFHRILLHSAFNWIGKRIHQTHHEKNYFHVSIDPPELLLGWLFVAHFLMRLILPWDLCLTATVGYSLAGLFYEWSHYIVHTRVKPPASSSSSQPFLAKWVSSFFSKMRDNHIRHHLVDDQYWYAFSVPAMDDMFGTNPDVRELKHRKQRNC